MKMVKHCHDSLPVMVSGTLLGLAKNSVLEVTYCFPETDDDSLNEMRSVSEATTGDVRRQGFAWTNSSQKAMS